MRITALSGLSAATQRQVEALIDAIDRIAPFLVAIPASERFRSIIADDAEIEGQLFSPEAFAVIRAGTRSTFPVGVNTMAMDGRKIREFLPVWDKIVEELSLVGEARIRTVDEVTSRDINDSIDRVFSARNGLLGLLPFLAIGFAVHLISSSYQLNKSGFGLSTSERRRFKITIGKKLKLYVLLLVLVIMYYYM